MAYISGKTIDLIGNSDKLVLINDYEHFYTIGVDALGEFFADDEEFIKAYEDYDIVLDFTVCFNYKPTAKYPYKAEDFDHIGLMHQIDDNLYQWLLTRDEEEMLAQKVCDKINEYTKAYNKYNKIH